RIQLVLLPDVFGGDDVEPDRSFAYGLAGTRRTHVDAVPRPDLRNLGHRRPFEPRRLGAAVKHEVDTQALLRRYAAWFLRRESERAQCNRGQNHRHTP